MRKFLIKDQSGHLLIVEGKSPDDVVAKCIVGKDDISQYRTMERVRIGVAELPKNFEMKLYTCTPDWDIEEAKEEDE